MKLRHSLLGLILASPIAACGVGYSQAEHDNSNGVHPIGTAQPPPGPSTSPSPTPTWTGAPDPTGTAPPTPPPAPQDTLWVSDDGPILGLATSTDRIVVVTETKVVSLLRNGTDVRPLASSQQSFAYGGAIAVDEAVTYFGTNGGVSAVATDGSSVAVSLGSEGFATVGIAFDDTNVYWLTNDAVNAVPRQGGATKTLAHVRGLTYGNAFTLVGGILYWSTNGSVASSDIAELASIPVSGGTPQVVATHNVYSLVPNGAGGVAWLEEPQATLVNAYDQVPNVPLSGWVSEAASDEGGLHWYFRDEGTGTIGEVSPGGHVKMVVPAAPKAGNSFAAANNGSGPHIVANDSQIIWADRTIAYDSNIDLNVVRWLDVD